MWLIIFTIVIGFISIQYLLRRLTVGDFKDKFVFVTGCDTGFGNRLAKRLDELGFHVIASCLTQTAVDDLKHSSSSRLQTIILDVTSEADIIKAVSKVESLLPTDKGLWAVVNNAGIGGAIGPIECMRRQDIVDTLSVNLLAVVDVTRQCLPLLRKSKGRVVNIASMLGRIATVPAPYCISKFGVEAFSDCLRREVYHQGIKVSILEPGYFKTEIVNLPKIAERFEKTFKQGDARFQEYFGTKYFEDVNKLIASTWSSENVHEVVDAYIHAITAKFPKYRYVVGKDANIIARFLWTVPEWLSDFMICFMLPRPQGSL